MWSRGLPGRDEISGSGRMSTCGRSTCLPNFSLNLPSSVMGRLSILDPSRGRTPQWVLVLKIRGLMESKESVNLGHVQIHAELYFSISRILVFHLINLFTDPQARCNRLWNISVSQWACF